MKCVIITGGPELDVEALRASLAEEPAPFVICADHGYDNARRAGVSPHLLLGDFDSMEADRKMVEGQPETIVYPAEKDDTDTVAAVKEALRRGFREVELHGATGARLDHCLGNVACLLYLANRDAQGTIYYPWGSISLVRKEKILMNQKGKTVSLLPIGGPAAGVTLEGFYYPLHEYTMQPEYPIGISNVVTSDQAVIRVREGDLLLFQNKTV
ncbi:MAG: thiamine diphosphokinase [Eubacteriales bacterium]|jgi:thiamine pyrophosphokinase